MVSLLILGVVVGWVVLWVYVFRHARNKAERVAAVLIAVLVPFWDLPIGYFEFRTHCSDEGGLRVYEKIASQDKVYFEALPSDLPASMLKQGFKVVEVRRADGGGITRHELREDRVVRRTVEFPESLMAISVTRNDRLPWNIYRDQQVLHRSAENKVLASHTSFSWQGGWLEGTGWKLFSRPFDCFVERTDPLITLLHHGS